MLVRKPEGKRPLGRPRLRWYDNIKKDFGTLNVRVWIGSRCLRVGTGGKIL